MGWLKAEGREVGRTQNAWGLVDWEEAGFPLLCRGKAWDGFKEGSNVI